MKKNNIVLIVFTVFIFIIGALNLIQNGNNIVQYIDNKEVDIDNFRDGSFFIDIEEEFSNNFIFKDTFIKISNNLDNLKGITNEMKIIDTQGINVAENWREEEKDLDENLGQKPQAFIPSLEEKDEENKEEDIGEINKNTAFGSILILEKKAMELNKYNQEALKNYYSIINEIAENTEDVEIYSMLIPTQVEYIKHERINEISYPQKDVIDEVYNNLKDVKYIDVYDILEEKNSEYIYFKTDHHWTQLGAYYAYTEFVENIGDIPKEINAFEIKEIENFLGSLHRVTGSIELEKNPDTILVYRDEINSNIYSNSTKEEKISNIIDLNIDFENTENKYGVFLGGDKDLMYIEGNIRNDKSIMIVKDSYGNAFIPFLINHFEKIYIVDPRLYSENAYDLIEKENIQNILFLNYALVVRYDGYNNLLLEIFKNKSPVFQ